MKGAVNSRRGKLRPAALSDDTQREVVGYVDDELAEVLAPVIRLFERDGLPAGPAILEDDGYPLLGTHRVTELHGHSPAQPLFSTV